MATWPSDKMGAVATQTALGIMSTSEKRRTLALRGKLLTRPVGYFSSVFVFSVSGIVVVTRSKNYTGMGRMTTNKGNFSLLDGRVNSPYCHSVF